MPQAHSDPASAADSEREAGVSPGGVLGSRPAVAETFHGRDPDRVATSTICELSPTRCQARTRLYRDGNLELEGFPVAEISDHLADEAVTIWLDLRDPDPDDLAVLSNEFGLHPLAVEDAVHEHQRPKLDRYRGYLFLNAYGARLDARTGELATSELAAFVTPRADHRAEGRRPGHRRRRGPRASAAPLGWPPRSPSWSSPASCSISSSSAGIGCKRRQDAGHRTVGQ